MRNNDLFLCMTGGFQLMLKPSPLCSGVGFKLSEIADQGDRVQENEAVSMVAEGGVIADVVVLGELLEGRNIADIVVSGEKMDGLLELGECILESLDLVVVSTS